MFTAPTSNSSPQNIPVWRGGVGSEEKKEKGGANEWWDTPISSFGGSFVDVVKFYID